MNAQQTTRPRVPCSSQRRGATAVEMALTAPILFMLVLGAIEFSRANMLVHTASIAATEAARKSIIPGATAAEIRSEGMSQLALIGVSDATLTVTPAEILPSTEQVTVQLDVPVNMRNGYLLPRVFLGRSVRKSVTLQREGKQTAANSETVTPDGMRGSMQGNGYDGLANPNAGAGNNNAGGNGKAKSGKSGSNASATGQANAAAGSAAANAGS
ncbi:MAG: pilus assembly protein [Planctomycetales bacterium]|nr:pilus assembly protein [Planctomycetales bacterium]